MLQSCRAVRNPSSTPKSLVTLSLGQPPSPLPSLTVLEDVAMANFPQSSRIWDRCRLQQSLTTATSTRTEGGESRPRAPVFQTEGATKEEDMTEGGESEERSAEESGREEIYVGDKETAPLMKPLSRVSFTSAPMTHIICTSFSKYISSQHCISITTLSYLFPWFRKRKCNLCHLDSDE